MSRPKLELNESSEIVSYCAEEVRRQQRGLLQVDWMYYAWMEAIEAKASRAKLSHALIQHWAFLIERDRNAPQEYRHSTVRVGSRICPSPQELGRLMDRWLENLSAMEPLEAYKEFEYIHPFADGNGRTGKIILNWLSDTLRTPFFPPADLFGYPITNP